jgi:metal-responsive CopG/Arc/MetJ family transcriptional regulator
MPKSKVSVTLDDRVLARVDRIANGGSRSEIIERALRSWLSDQRRIELEDEIAAYYEGLGNAERDEDREWAELSARHLRKTWD